MLFAFFFIVKQKIERKKQKKNVCAGSSTEHTRRFVIGTSKIRIYEDKSFGAHFIEIYVRRRRHHHHHHQLLSSRDPLFDRRKKEIN